MQPNPYMQRALALAATHLGVTAENPSVGCVIVNKGDIVGEGVTGLGGRPHAETQALAAAGERARGADVYVTLEPCAHTGKTPPCSKALIEAGVARVFIACTDEDTRVAGRGIAQLKAAGIDVITGLHEHEARTQHTGFFRTLTHGLPHVTMKIATSMDGFMASADASERWITGEFARTHGQRLRAHAGAIITGIGTVLADDPLLTCRIQGLEHRSPMRIILDRSLRLPLTSHIVKTAETIPTYVFTTHDAMQHSSALELRERGVNLVALDEVSFLNVLKEAVKLRLTHVLIEAGPSLSEAFLRSTLVDRLLWYRAPQALKHKGTHPFSCPISLPEPSKQMLAQDALSVYPLTPCLPD